MIEQIKGQEIDKNFEVFEENWEIVRFFLRLQTQWRVFDGVFVGLDYTAVEALFRIYKTDNSIELFEGLQIMEIAALGALNKRKD